jgi:hypothetical protein
MNGRDNRTGERIEWRTPAPLWDLALADGDGGGRLRQPALLRFDSESFMDQVSETLTRAPERLRDYVARPEHWQAPAAGWAAAGDASLTAALKLFQPAQSRFYLVAASLVCLRTGLPERKIKRSAEERVGAVVRRLVARPNRVLDPADAATYAEQAWIGDREQGRWQALADQQALAEGEERLPLFPLGLSFEGRARQLHLAMLPVAGREVYEIRAPAGVAPAPLTSPPGETDPLIALADPRKATWANGPGAALALYAGTKNAVPDGAPPDLSPGAEMGEEDARELLRFTLLDMADFLAAELPGLWQAIRDESAAGLSGAASAVYGALGGLLDTGLTWREALRRTDAQRDALLRGDDPPAGSDPPVPVALSRDDIADAAATLLAAGPFEALLYAALDELAPTAEPVPGGAPSAAAAAAARTRADGAFYVVRCVFERPRCTPYVDAVVSEPSRPFRLAPFFDPEAPVRPVTIRMPLDTGIRGLSRFPKGVNLVLSDKLRQQVEHLQKAKLGDLDEGNISNAPPGWGIGMLCSLSIPIITICAMIVLMIFIQLLNIVFWWLPFLRICLPIPVRRD